MYPVDVVPFVLDHAWVAGIALLVGALLGRLLPRAIPHAVLIAGLGASAYFTWMAWLIEGNVWIPLGFLAIAVLVSLVLSLVVRYMTTAFEFAMFGAGWYLVLFARLGASLGGTTLEGALALVAAIASVAATIPVARWANRRVEKRAPAAPTVGRRPTAA